MTHATTQPGPTQNAPLTADELADIDAYWRAANYLSVGQIYLLDNPLLRAPLRIEHVKPRLLGHWGTTPGLNFIYAHMNRVIRRGDLNVIYVTGPGHGGPALVANTYLEGTYSEIYPHIGLDEEGLRRLFRQFSFPGGIPSHVAPETPGSINEGGELGYSLMHAYGAALDNPDLLVCCVVGDGEAETGPLATSWHSNKFLDPISDGAVLPILHLNGYKIANPTVLARIPEHELLALLEGYGYAPRLVSGSDPEPMHQQMAATLDEVIGEIRALQRHAREHGDPTRPRWPMIVLRTPKGWTGPKEVDGVPIEGTFRATRCRSPNSPSGPSTCASSRPGCAHTAPRSCSRRPARLEPSSGRWPLTASGGWAQTRTPTAACSPSRLSCPASAPTRLRCRRPPRASPRPPGCSAPSCAT
jgi:xylulose-5-phosphate/fructose-6-phosphate phosphoketolase